MVTLVSSELKVVAALVLDSETRRQQPVIGLVTGDISPASTSMMYLTKLVVPHTAGFLSEGVKDGT